MYRCLAYRFVEVELDDRYDLRMFCMIGQGTWNWRLCSNIVKYVEEDEFITFTTRSGKEYLINTEENGEVCETISKLLSNECVEEISLDKLLELVDLNNA